MDAIIDEDETFGIEIEGIISSSNGESEPCYGERCDCYGECGGFCCCEEYRIEMRNENIMRDGVLNDEGENTSPVIHNEEEIENYECDYCSGECDCSLCRGDCQCDTCTGDCECTTRQTGRTRRELARYIGDYAGVECHSEGWNTQTKDYWKVIYDGSVSGEGEDCEVISPPIKGKKGLEDVKKVVDAMQEFGVDVNTSTGLHVHHDARNVSTDALAMLVQLYAFYEGVFDTFQPKSRRGQNTYYCRSVKHFFDSETALEVFERINDRLKRTDSSCEKIGKSINKGIKDNNFSTLFQYEYGHGRYCKLNLNAYHKHGTIEFRHHSGTVDSEKICNWVELTQALVKYCQKKKSRITGKHNPTFKKLMELAEVREEIYNYYDSRRKHFAEKYGKVDYQCTDHKRGYK